MERVFLSTTGGGVARAECAASGRFDVETLLAGMGVRCLAQDRINRQRVYAGAQGAGVLRSDDRGKTWQPAGLAGHAVTALAASPTQPDVVYAGTRPTGVYVSVDGGVNWEELRRFRRIPERWLWFSPAEPPFTASVQAIALSPTDPARIIIGVEAGATVMSRDGGASWSLHLPHSLRDCHNLAFHATNGDWVYEAGGSGGGAAYSRDGGQTWMKAGQGLDRHYGWSVAGDPVDPAIWYVSVSPGPFNAHGDGDARAYIFRHEPSGWRRLAGGLSQPLAHMPYALIPDIEVRGLLFAGLSNGDVWQSQDHGESWAQLPVNMGQIRRTMVAL